MCGAGAVYQLNIVIVFCFFVFFWLVSAVVKQPSGAQQSHILATEKMGEMRQNKLAEGKKTHLLSFFSASL